MEHIFLFDWVHLEHDFFESTIEFVLSRLSEHAHEFDSALAHKLVLEDLAPFCEGLFQEKCIGQLLGKAFARPHHSSHRFKLFQRVVIEHVAVVFELKDLEYHLTDFILMLFKFLSFESFLKVERLQERDEIARDLKFEVCKVLAGRNII